jgi:hypothetical protein
MLDGAALDQLRVRVAGCWVRPAAVRGAGVLARGAGLSLEGGRVSWVYLLWSHDEHGPEGLRATLDRAKVQGMAQAQCDAWLRVGGTERMEAANKRAMERLAGLLASDAGPEIYPLMDGWGGLHLQIVVLE